MTTPAKDFGNMRSFRSGFHYTTCIFCEKKKRILVGILFFELLGLERRDEPIPTEPNESDSSRVVFNLDGLKAPTRESLQLASKLNLCLHIKPFVDFIIEHVIIANKKTKARVRGPGSEVLVRSSP